MAEKFKIRKGDDVVVLTGRDKGKSGTVLRVLREENRAIVEGVNMIRRHTRPSQTQPGGIIDKDMPLDASNVMLVHKGKKVRVGYQVQEDGTKVRVARPSGEVIG